MPRLGRAFQGPRERLATLGPEGMSDLDLLTMLLSPGTRQAPADIMARRLLLECGGLHGLAGRRPGELAGFPGMGLAKACRVIAAIEMARRLIRPLNGAVTLGSAADVGRHAARYALEREEVFVAVAVNHRNRLQGEWIVARGWESGINLTARQVFTLLVKEAASRVIFVHNHPAGDPNPSAEDIRFTSRLIEAGRCLEIKVLDHVIVAASGHSSLRECAGDRLAFDG